MNHNSDILTTEREGLKQDYLLEPNNDNNKITETELKYLNNINPYIANKLNTNNHHHHNNKENSHAHANNKQINPFDPIVLPKPSKKDTKKKKENSILHTHSKNKENIELNTSIKKNIKQVIFFCTFNQTLTRISNYTNFEILKLLQEFQKDNFVILQIDNDPLLQQEVAKIHFKSEFETYICQMNTLTVDYCFSPVDEYLYFNLSVVNNIQAENIEKKLIQIIVHKTGIFINNKDDCSDILNIFITKFSFKELQQKEFFKLAYKVKEKEESVVNDFKIKTFINNEFSTKKNNFKSRGKKKRRNSFSNLKSKNKFITAGMLGDGRKNKKRNSESDQNMNLKFRQLRNDLNSNYSNEVIGANNRKRKSANKLLQFKLKLDEEIDNINNNEQENGFKSVRSLIRSNTINDKEYSSLKFNNEDNNGIRIKNSRTSAFLTQKSNKEEDLFVIRETTKKSSKLTKKNSTPNTLQYKNEDKFKIRTSNNRNTLSLDNESNNSSPHIIEIPKLKVKVKRHTDNIVRAKLRISDNEESCEFDNEDYSNEEDSYYKNYNNKTKNKDANSKDSKYDNYNNYFLNKFNNTDGKNKSKKSTFKNKIPDNKPNKGNDNSDKSSSSINISKNAKKNKSNISIDDDNNETSQENSSPESEDSRSNREYNSSSKFSSENNKTIVSKSEKSSSVKQNRAESKMNLKSNNDNNPFSSNNFLFDLNNSSNNNFGNVMNTINLEKNANLENINLSLSQTAPIDISNNSNVNFSKSKVNNNDHNKSNLFYFESDRNNNDNHLDNSQEQKDKFINNQNKNIKLIPLTDTPADRSSPDKISNTHIKKDLKKDFNEKTEHKVENDNKLKLLIPNAPTHTKNKISKHSKHSKQSKEKRKASILIPKDYKENNDDFEITNHQDINNSMNPNSLKISKIKGSFKSSKSNKKKKLKKMATSNLVNNREKLISSSIFGTLIPNKNDKQKTVSDFETTFNTKRAKSFLKQTSSIGKEVLEKVNEDELSDEDLENESNNYKFLKSNLKIKNEDNSLPYQEENEGLSSLSLNKFVNHSSKKKISFKEKNNSYNSKRKDSGKLSKNLNNTNDSIAGSEYLQVTNFSTDDLIYWILINSLEKLETFSNCLVEEANILKDMYIRISENERSDFFRRIHALEISTQVIFQEVIIKKKFLKYSKSQFKNYNKLSNNFYFKSSFNFFVELMISKVTQLEIVIDKLQGIVRMIKENYLITIEDNTHMQNIKLNMVMKVLAIITTIYAPFDIVAALFGMNVRVPFQDSETLWPFFGILAVLIIIFFCQLILFKRLNWF